MKICVFYMVVCAKILNLVKIQRIPSSLEACPSRRGDGGPGSQPTQYTKKILKCIQKHNIFISLQQILHKFYHIPWRHAWARNERSWRRSPGASRVWRRQPSWNWSTSCLFPQTSIFTKNTLISIIKHIICYVNARWGVYLCNGEVHYTLPKLCIR